MYVSRSKHRNQCRRCHRRSKKGSKRPRRRQLLTNQSWDRFLQDGVLRRWQTSIDSTKSSASFCWKERAVKENLDPEDHGKQAFAIPVDVCPSVADLSKSFKERRNITSYRKRRVHEKSFKNFPKTKKPYVSQVNRFKWLQYLRRYLHWTVDQWKNKISFGLTNHNLFSAAKAANTICLASLQ